MYKNISTLRVITLAILLLSSSVSANAERGPLATVTLVDFEVVSERKMERGFVEFHMLISARNESSEPVRDVLVTLGNASAELEVTEGTARLGDIGALRTATTDAVLRFKAKRGAVTRLGIQPQKAKKKSESKKDHLFSDRYLSASFSGVVAFDEKAHIRGIDADDSGVRDDVEAYIDREFSLGSIRGMALRNLGRILQEQIEGEMSIEEALASADLYFIHSQCLSRVSAEYPELVQRLWAETLNTEIRFDAYASFARRIDFQSRKLVPDEQIDQTCASNYSL